MSRVLRDESGIAMGLAVILIVIIGVMGAGLLVFVRNDLEAVVEVNQGQRAFEMADAGVQAAEQQIDKESESSSYDGNGTDSQWSESEGGVELRDLDQDGDSEDSVRVTIDYDSGDNEYTAISTGSYGGAKRKVEAVFQSSTGAGVNGIPAYYTPGSIELKKDAEVRVSFFAGKNIEFGKDTLVTDTEDPLEDWRNSPYNTVGREKDGEPYTKIGLAAEGYICGENGSCAGPEDSIADGITGYDETTGSKGNNLKFVEKNPPDKIPNETGTITYPFPRIPNVDGLLEEANSGSPNVYEELSSNNYDLSGNASKRVVFIDAEGGTVKLAKNSTYKGILVVRCGDLSFQENVEFEGIIMLLKGEGESCDDKGKFKVDKNYTMKGYVYAQSMADDAMYIKKSATLGSPPEGQYEDYLELAYRQPIKLDSWRELYE